MVDFSPSSLFLKINNFRWINEDIYVRRMSMKYFPTKHNTWSEYCRFIVTLGIENLSICIYNGLECIMNQLVPYVTIFASGWGSFNDWRLWLFLHIPADHIFRKYANTKYERHMPNNTEINLLIYHIWIWKYMYLSTRSPFKMV